MTATPKQIAYINNLVMWARNDAHVIAEHPPKSDELFKLERVIDARLADAISIPENLSEEQASELIHVLKQGYGVDRLTNHAMRWYRFYVGASAPGGWVNQAELGTLLFGAEWGKIASGYIATILASLLATLLGDDDDQVGALKTWLETLE